MTGLLKPFNAAVQFWGQPTKNLSGLCPKTGTAVRPKRALTENRRNAILVSQNDYFEYSEHRITEIFIDLHFNFCLSGLSPERRTTVRKGLNENRRNAILASQNDYFVCSDHGTMEPFIGLHFNFFQSQCSGVTGIYLVELLESGASGKKGAPLL